MGGSFTDTDISLANHILIKNSKGKLKNLSFSMTTIQFEKILNISSEGQTMKYIIAADIQRYYDKKYLLPSRHVEGFIQFFIRHLKAYKLIIKIMKTPRKQNHFTL